MRKSIVFLLSFLFTTVSLFAQSNNETSAMVSNGKIYVVLAVCLTILGGLVLYLVHIDRKLSALEKKKD
jgi:hypothetical protein